MMKQDFMKYAEQRLKEKAMAKEREYTDYVCKRQIKNLRKGSR